jgi:hypothetical protein
MALEHLVSWHASDEPMQESMSLETPVITSFIENNSRWQVHNPSLH